VVSSCLLAPLSDKFFIFFSADISATASGNPSFRAFRLTPAFMDAYKKANFRTARYLILYFILFYLISDSSTLSLIEHRLTFSTILEEIPLKIRTNPLVNSFLGLLKSSSSTPLPSSLPPPPTASRTLPPQFTPLELGNAALTKNLEQIAETIDSYRTEEGNLAYLTRQITREKARAEAYVAKRKEENATRVAQGLAPLPEEDVSRVFKIPGEPSRLDSLLLLGKIDGSSKTLAGTASNNLVKMYGVKAGS
jgi:translation initiation factor 3 subunit H